MHRIAITGASGFLGWHLRTSYNGNPNVEVVPIDRDTFSDAKALSASLSDATAIIHLAGVNRGDEGEIERTNPALMQDLINACEKAAIRPHIVFASSTHRDRDTAYGRSKRRAAEMLKAWAGRNQGTATELVLPNLFGECGRPFYNSVVATFCHQLAEGEEPALHQDRDLDLLHAQEVAERILSIVTQGEAGQLFMSGRVLRVSELLALVRLLHSGYCRDGVVPTLDDPFQRALFNTLRSYLFPAHYPVVLDIHSDGRGHLFEGLKTLSGGQVFLSTTHPGITRGSHYHTRKFERFLVLDGRARVRVRKMFSSVTETLFLNGESPAYVDIPTLHTHDITNVGDGPLVTLFWADEIFDPNHPDTIAERVAE